MQDYRAQSFIASDSFSVDNYLPSVRIWWKSPLNYNPFHSWLIMNIVFKNFREFKLIERSGAYCFTVVCLSISPSVYLSAQTEHENLTFSHYS